MKGTILRYSITTGICLIGAFLIMIFKDIFHQTEAKTVYHILTDSFFVSGVIMTGYGLLVFASNEGTFDMLKYALRRMFFWFKRNPIDEKYRTFYDYRMAQREKTSSFGYLIIVGIVFILIGLSFLAFYYQA